MKRISQKLREKRGRRRERILTVAENYIYKHGFYKLSIDDLVRTLRVSKSTIYENFGSKEGLIEEIVDRLGEKLESELGDIVFNEDLSVAQRLLEVAKFQGNITFELTNKFTEDLRLHTPDLWAKYLAGKQRRIDHYYRKLIDEGFRSKLFSGKVSRDFALQLYLNMSKIVCEVDFPEKVSMTRPEAFEQIVNVFIRGLAK